MAFEQFGLVLAIVAALLAVVGVLGVVLALSFSKPSPPPDRPAEAAKEAAAKPTDEKVLASRRAAYRQGLLVLVGLAVLTALEFWIAAAAGGSAVFLFILILAKAGLIVQYFMHAGRLWGEEEAH